MNNPVRAKKQTSVNVEAELSWDRLMLVTGNRPIRLAQLASLPSEHKLRNYPVTMHDDQVLLLNANLAKVLNK
jgi:hypothetical protein